ncbi:MAG: peptide chain release factor N(5)-glutamine methyltransferase [Candidatus Cloacimonetes bacterium]|nr:peptide chain release factor N(5)-glutamine methyltransferase [Candidatus Cloacimonadota bacterium]MCF7813201.1 peptide chain release factor N(5)-glutamine methyltransferase [Candidatus Cloacimonadota bacterium]MCF7867400.1 peptide chain release factor N(5)-glutamine methyltransferase [Candidatus Cloacimonadota bacterium]MCF7882968.1 peptide chain release factor N(5)-glutamine methyltransferase [Candidatus Cloacimonadota bacterium]
MKILNLLEQAKNSLKQAGSTNPKLDAELIISHFTGINRLELNLHADDEVSEESQIKIKKAIQRRIDHEPIQYILGETEFYGLQIKVNPSVLIPRPETELLVEKIIDENPAEKSILEIGSGSGCIAITLKKLLPDSSVTATDISGKALKTTQENAETNQTEIDFIQSDLFDNISGRFDLIVSNPPYIPKDEYKKLSTEIKKFEPESALLANEDGIYFYRQILEKAKQFLNNNGKIYFEIGYDQAERIREIALRNGFTGIEVFQDLNGFDRMMRIE